MPRRMDYDTAVAFALDEFERRHPRESWPEWLSRCTVLNGTRDETKRWVVSLVATPKEPPDEGRGDSGASKVGPRESVVIDRAPREVVIVFKAAVDSETAEVTVLTDGDLSLLSGPDLQGF